MCGGTAASQHVYGRPARLSNLESYTSWRPAMLCPALSPLPAGPDGGGRGRGACSINQTFTPEIAKLASAFTALTATNNSKPGINQPEQCSLVQGWGGALFATFSAWPSFLSSAQSCCKLSPLQTDDHHCSCTQSLSRCFFRSGPAHLEHSRAPLLSLSRPCSMPANQDARTTGAQTAAACAANLSPKARLFNTAKETPPPYSAASTGAVTAGMCPLAVGAAGCLPAAASSFPTGPASCTFTGEAAPMGPPL